MSELVAAVESGEVGHVRQAIQRGVNIDITVKEHRTALHLAAMRGYDVIIGELLENKAFPGVQDENGWIPLHLATAAGSVRSVERLVGEQVDPELRALQLSKTDKNGMTPLLLGAAVGQVACMEALLNAGASPLQTTQDGRTLLHVAAEQGQTAVLTMLLKAGANVGAKDKMGRTPADIAHQKGHAPVVALLTDSSIMALNMLHKVNQAPPERAASGFIIDNGIMASVPSGTDAMYPTVGFAAAVPVYQGASTVYPSMLDSQHNEQKLWVVPDQGGHTSLTAAGMPNLHQHTPAPGAGSLV